MQNILLAASVVGALVLALTQVVKQLIPDNKWLPVINIALGVTISLLYAVTMEPTQLAIYGWAGLFAGLAAGGFYDLGANVKGLSNQKSAKKLIDEGAGKQDTGEGE
ncbi:hypothetical protein P7G51_06285 [Enterococcus asini]|uniref:hypothetical protein n=1 Tax=Enterococcus asini TaxID=57732 RepID=UPI0022E0C4E1|nr:hypothetical protein [Enterococcus asini]MDT2756985.1 hypothetical protein [Enterococcus asini]